MSLRLIKDLQFTQIEFGALYTIYESLKTAKTKKEHAKLLSAIHSYIKSLGSNGILEFIPKKFSVYYVKEEVDTGTFPSDILYVVTIREEEAEENEK